LSLQVLEQYAIHDSVAIEFLKSLWIDIKRF
jgi:hypothetical protein